jgi:hypothetical protein
MATENGDRLCEGVSVRDEKDEGDEVTRMTKTRWRFPATYFFENSLGLLMRKVIGSLFILGSYSLFAQSPDTIPAIPQNKFIVYPVFYFSPETSLGLGVTTFKLFHIGKESRTSNMSGTAMYTFKNQLLVDGSTTMFLDHEKWLIKGRVGARHFPEYFYGVGEKTPKADKMLTSYSYYNVSGMFYRRLFKGAFLGIQTTYNNYFDVSFKGSTPTDLVGVSGANNFGLGGSFLLDRRDNIINARKGVYAELSALVFSDQMGSKYSYKSYVVDFRKYFSLNEKSVIAFQVMSLMKVGIVPFLQLSYLGGSDIMRGFYSGRYRDKVLVATQVEYRRQLTEDFGAVAFFGLGNVTDVVSNFDFRNLKNSIGIGGRYMLDKKDRMNLRMDVGFGNGHPNFYIAVAEAF